MKYRPAIFARMGGAFTQTLGNVECEFTIAGVVLPAVRGILRQNREIGLAEELSQAVEGTTHLLSVTADSVAGLVSQRDKVTVFELGPAGDRLDAGVTFEVRNHTDDGRAMVQIYLKGDI